MVDLAKIRKKAKKKGEAEGEGASPSETANVIETANVQEPAPVEPEPQHAAPPPAPVSQPAAADAPPAAKSTPEPAPAKVEPAEPPREAKPDSSKLERFMAEAGRKRDEAIATAAAEVASGEEILELLTFVIAGEQYAVDIETIVEIVRPKSLTRIPNADPSIVGIMSLRGTIVTLVDARLRLGHKDKAVQTDDTRVVVIDRGGEIVGFEVDRVIRVVKVAHDTVEPHPVVHASEQHDAIRGVFKVANALTILLDLDKLLDHTGQVADKGAKAARAAHR